jgi:hypothetical protein
MIFNTLVLISFLICILPLRRFVGIFPSLMACLVRWKESINLDASVQLSRDRDIMAIAMVMPFCLTAGKFALYSPSWTGQFGADGKLGITIGAIIAYIMLRKGLEHLLRGKKINQKTYRSACKSSHTFFIILTLLLMAMGGIMSFVNVAPMDIKNAMLWVSAAIYAIFLLRKTQIFTSSCSFFSGFLYLCALEILPTGALVASALIF